MSAVLPDDCALRYVDEKIAAAVSAAPPLTEDLAARLVELIRTAPAVKQRGAAD